MRCEIRSPIAGSVWSHVATVGQSVMFGSTLIVVESMKTEFAIEATDSGVVTWIRSCGETVEADDVVAVLEVA